MGKLTMTLRVDNEITRPKYPQFGHPETVTETETLCNIEGQHFSKGMLAAALRQLADEIDPQHKCEVAF
jgi:hypothetical protein